MKRYLVPRGKHDTRPGEGQVKNKSKADVVRYPEMVDSWGLNPVLSHLAGQSHLGYFIKRAETNYDNPDSEGLSRKHYLTKRLAVTMHSRKPLEPMSLNLRPDPSAHQTRAQPRAIHDRVDPRNRSNSISENNQSPAKNLSNSP